MIPLVRDAWLPSALSTMARTSPVFSCAARSTACSPSGRFQASVAADDEPFEIQAPVRVRLVEDVERPGEETVVEPVLAQNRHGVPLCSRLDRPPDRPPDKTERTGSRSRYMRQARTSEPASRPGTPPALPAAPRP